MLFNKVHSSELAAAGWQLEAFEKESRFYHECGVFGVCNLLDVFAA